MSHLFLYQQRPSLHHVILYISSGLASTMQHCILTMSQPPPCNIVYQQWLSHHSAVDQCGLHSPLSHHFQSHKTRAEYGDRVNSNIPPKMLISHIKLHRLQCTRKFQVEWQWKMSSDNHENTEMLRLTF